MIGFLMSLLGGGMKQQAQQPQMPQVSMPKMVDPTQGMNSMTTQKATNAFLPTATDPYGYTPSTAVTVPGMPSNVAAGKVPNTGNPLLIGHPQQKQPQGAWVDAWRQARNLQYKGQDEVAKSNPVYGAGLALGQGLFNLGHGQQRVASADKAIQNLF